MILKRWYAPILLFIMVVTLLSGCGSPEETPAAPTASAEPTPTGPGTAQPTVAPLSLLPPGVEAALKHIVRLEGETVLARVNGDEITWEDYEPNLYQALVSIEQQSPVNWNDPAMQERLKFLQNEVLKNVVDVWLLRQLAAEQGIAVDEAELETTMETQRSGILDSGRFPDWDTFLQANGLTDRSFQHLIADKLLMDALMARQQVESIGEQAHIRHIIVGDEATAQEIVAKLEAGGDFAELAAQYSLDEQTKDSGGDLGWFSVEMMMPEFQQVASTLEPGEFSDPISTRGGYAILLVVERGIRELDSRLIQQKQQAAVMAQIQAMRAEATIEYLVDFAEDQEP